MAFLEQRISLVTLSSRDLDASRRFYAALGWRPGFENQEVCFFQMNGLVLGLWHRAAMAQALGLPEDRLGPGGMEVAHNVRRRQDVDAAVAAMARAGGDVLIPAHDTPWGGRSGHVADPDGHRWEVAWNPVWTVSPEGRTVMDGQ